MKSLLTCLLLTAALFVGCVDDSSLLTSPDTSTNPNYSSPNWVQLPGIYPQGPGIETQYSASKLIKGKKGGDIKLKFNIKRDDHPLGDFKFNAKIKVLKYSFPDEEERLFTVSFDPELAYLNITPSPNTLYEHIEIDWELEGIDVSQINPDTFSFLYVGDNSELLETSSEELDIDYNKNKIKVKEAKIHPHDPEYTPPGSRYGFTR
ncbi:hypothetical protein ACFLSS_03420 [Bacteroidota bacterium]